MNSKRDSSIDLASVASMNSKKDDKSMSNLFPTRASFFVFIAYMALFINQGLLVTSTKTKDNKFDYNPITVVLLTEFLKMLLSSLIYLKNNNLAQMWHEILRNHKILIKYFIPSFLYCLYNNLTFVNLSSYDPTTYFLLLQFRVVVTGILFEILFAKRLSKPQWLSLILLTIGCIIKQISYANSNSSPSSSSSSSAADKFQLFDYVNTSLILILVQVFSSCFAGVYNEYLLKERDNNVDIMLQNVFMYIDSIVCNLILLTIYAPDKQTSAGSGLLDAFSYEALSNVFRLKVVLIMFNNAAIGIVTSLFLRYLNSILKAFASALELMFTGILSWIIFSIPLDSSTVLSICIVSFATWLYSKNPVHNPAQNLAPQNSASLGDKTKNNSTTV